MLSNVLSDCEPHSWNSLTSSEVEVGYPNFSVEEKDILMFSKE